jgi:hypothetical protein
MGHTGYARMSEREAFEQLYRNADGSAPDFSRNIDDEYRYLSNEYRAYRAATAAERERCARVCETLYEDGPRGSDQDSFATCQDCAAAIRSGK